MTEINAALVKELREETNIGMMECKRALVEANGDKAKAVKILRERGLAVAEKKSGRAANHGVIASSFADDGRAGSLVEVNCETDFVAKNGGFQAFARTLAEKAALSDAVLADQVKDQVIAKVLEIGENIVVRRNARLVLQDPGLLAAYIHHGNNLGVLLELGCGNSAIVGQDVFKQLAKDLCLHIAASSPRYLDRKSVPADVIAMEREIYAKQVQGKPANIVEKIVGGKLNKFCEQTCLVEQPFVKDQDQTIAALLKEKSAALGDTPVIRRFLRFQVGEKI